MKFTQRQTMVALIAVVLFASGCASTGGGGGGNSGDTGSSTSPINVQEFNAFPNPAPDGNVVTFTLKLKNTGSVKAQHVIAKLWNPPFAEENGDDRTWQDSNGNNVTIPERSFKFGNLRGTSEGIETFAQTKTLRLTAPSLNEGQSFPYNFHSRIYYQYNTKGSTTVTVMGNQKYRESGASKSRTVSISHNDAPISLEGQLLAGNPIVFYETGSSKKVQFCVVVNNEGSGTVFKRGGADMGYQSGSERYIVTEGGPNAKGNKNRVKLSVKTLGSTEVSNSKNEGYDTKVTDSIKLIGGDQRRKCFWMRVQSLTSDGQTEIGPINVEATYGYAIDTSTKVTVNAGR